MDEIERAVRSARPDLGRRDDPLTVRAQHQLQEILEPTSAMPKPQQLGWRIARIAAPLGLAAAALTVFAVLQLPHRDAPPPQVLAAAPPQLNPQPVDEGVTEVLAQLAAVASGAETSSEGPGSTVDDAADPEAPVLSPDAGNVSYETWSLPPDDAIALPFVQPLEVVQQRRPDGSGTLTTRAGDIRWGAPDDDNPAQNPGELLNESVSGPGEFPLVYRLQPPNNASQYPEYLLAAGQDPTAPTGEQFQHVQEIAKEWALDGQQTAALIQYIATFPEVTVAGTVTDRLGRDGIAVQTRTRQGGSLTDTLIFDSVTGRLLSAEESCPGDIEVAGCPASTVLSYIAWVHPADSHPVPQMGVNLWGMASHQAPSLSSRQST